jgi:hypothetical protein
MKRVILIFIIILIFLILIIVTLIFIRYYLIIYTPEISLLETEGYIPPDGFVPDKETAIKIAEAIWFPIYGKKVLRQKPYKVKLIDETIWIVEGTLKGIPFVVGGTAYIEINKNTGEILKVTHSK